MSRLFGNLRGRGSPLNLEIKGSKTGMEFFFFIFNHRVWSMFLTYYFIHLVVSRYHYNITIEILEMAFVVFGEPSALAMFIGHYSDVLRL